jgi:hypothetical protein
MAFEQFFYNGDVKLTLGGESANYRTEILPDGTPLGRGALSIPPIDGGIICSGEADVQVIYAPITSSAGFNSRWPSGNNIEDNIFSVLTIITEIPVGGILVGGSEEAHMRFFPSFEGGVIAGGHGFSSEERPASGGVNVAGSAFVSEKDEEIGSGGIIVGGTNYWSDGVGGVKLGGASIAGVGIVAAGGITSGGLALENMAYDPLPIGGALLNGDAHNIENITVSGGVVLGGRNEAAETSQVGVLLGGHAFTVDDEVGVGGILLGGTAPNGTHDFGSGGVLLGGSILQQITQHVDASGVLIGGKAPEEPPALGGAILGGFVIQTFNETTSGGAVMGGRAIVEITPSIGSGSALLGGRSQIGIGPGIFGGVVLHGFGVQTFDETGEGGALAGGQGVDTQSAYHREGGGFIQVTQPDPNIYKITTKHYVYDVDEATAEVKIVGNAVVGKRFFGQSIPSFSFGKTPVKNEACRSFRENIRQPTVLAMTRTQTREWLEKLDPEDWSITSFDPKKREVCILVEAGYGITHLVTAELLLVDSGVGSP